MKKITAKTLGNFFFEEFEKGNWGFIDPYYFNSDARNDGCGGKEPEALEELLKKVIKKVNNFFKQK